ncbi:unnamed protein product [Closterium sp. Naga37s-1]|nr:unnamed protein product [Closterium sp. Naga37s-1]
MAGGSAKFLPLALRFLECCFCSATFAILCYLNFSWKSINVTAFLFGTGVTGLILSFILMLVHAANVAGVKLDSLGSQLFGSFSPLDSHPLPHPPPTSHPHPPPPTSYLPPPPSPTPTADDDDAAVRRVVRVRVLHVAHVRLVLHQLPPRIHVRLCVGGGGKGVWVRAWLCGCGCACAAPTPPTSSSATFQVVLRAHGDRDPFSRPSPLRTPAFPQLSPPPSFFSPRLRPRRSGHPPVQVSKWCCVRAEDDATIYRKKVMMNVTGGVAPGNLLAIMGPEGSGKSLLLHMLAGRLEGDANFRGSIEYSGEPFGATLRREIGFVENDVDLQANLTVKETLMFAAMLRLPEGTEEIDQIVRVEHVLDSLELTHCADKVIGRTGRNAVLYNELRRLAIGVQMIVNPPLLLLDEPTSGLDGAMALRITRALHSYALAGRSVVATMKQPSSKMFSLFTHLLLITDGNPIFFGAADAALPYFDSIGYTMAPDTSAAEFFLDLTAPEAADASIHFGTSTNLIRLWATGDAAREIERAAMPSAAAASAKRRKGKDAGNGDVEEGEGAGGGAGTGGGEEGGVGTRVRV